MAARRLHGRAERAVAQRQGHSAGYYTARGGVSPQLQCMMKGDETRGVVACAFDGCTGALPGQGHGVEPPTASSRPRRCSARRRSSQRRSCAPSPLPSPSTAACRSCCSKAASPTRPRGGTRPSASTLAHAPDIVGCALPSPSTFGIKNAKVMGFEFAQLGGEPKYLVKLPELSESGATMSPCFAHCPRRALRNAHEIAFVDSLRSLHGYGFWP